MPGREGVPPIDPEDLENLTQAINEFLDDFAVPHPVPFSFARLRREDQTRVPGLIHMLYQEDPFPAEHLLWGLVEERGDSLGKILDGAKWLGTVFRGVGEAELRKWIARGKEESAAAECRQREEADRQAQEATQKAEQERADKEARRAEEERRAKVRQEIDDLFDTYAMCWADSRPMDRAREIAHRQVDFRLSRGRIDEVLAEMKGTIARCAEWIAEYKAAGAEARCAREEADREAERQAKANKEAQKAERAKHLDDLISQYRRLTGKFPTFDHLAGYDAAVEQITWQISAAEVAAGTSGEAQS